GADWCLLLQRSCSMHRVRAGKMSALVAAVLSTGANSLLAAEPPTYEELLNENRALKARVEATAAQGPAYTAADADAAIDAVAQDADLHSRLFAAQPATAGYDNGFFIKSEDGNFTLKPGVQAQFR